MNRKLSTVISLALCCALAILATSAGADGVKNAAYPEPTASRSNSNRTRVTPRPYSTDEGSTFPIASRGTANTNANANTSSSGSSVAPAPTQSPIKKPKKPKRKQSTKRSN